MIKTKICGLTSLDDINYVNTLKPDYIGFVFAKSKRQLTTEKAFELKQNLDKNIKAVGVFVDSNNDDIIKLLDDNIIDIAQLHGSETEADIIYIKQKADKPVIKAIRVSSIDNILSWQRSSVDYLLLDNINAGSGHCFDWSMLDKLADFIERGDFSKQFFIAGGLSADNVSSVLGYEPYGVDVSSGVETDGKKDAQKIKNFIKFAKYTL